MVVICQEPGCPKQAKYGEPGSTKRLYCHEHGASRGLSRVSSHRQCSRPDCNKLARGTTQFCARHRLDKAKTDGDDMSQSSGGTAPAGHVINQYPGHFPAQPSAEWEPHVRRLNNIFFQGEVQALGGIRPPQPTAQRPTNGKQVFSKQPLHPVPLATPASALPLPPLPGPASTDYGGLLLNPATAPRPPPLFPVLPPNPVAPAAAPEATLGPGLSMAGPSSSSAAAPSSVSVFTPAAPPHRDTSTTTALCISLYPTEPGTGGNDGHDGDDDSGHGGDDNNSSSSNEVDKHAGLAGRPVCQPAQRPVESW